MAMAESSSSPRVEGVEGAAGSPPGAEWREFRVDSTDRLRESTFRDVRRRFRRLSSSSLKGFGRVLLGSDEPARSFVSISGDLDSRSIGLPAGPKQGDQGVGRMKSGLSSFHCDPSVAVALPDNGLRKLTPARWVCADGWRYAVDVPFEDIDIVSKGKGEDRERLDGRWKTGGVGLQKITNEAA